MDAASADPDLAAQSLGRATSLPARFYCEPAMAALDRRAVFDRGWQLVAHVSRLRDPGDHVVAGPLAHLPQVVVAGEVAVRVPQQCQLLLQQTEVQRFLGKDNGAA